MKTNKIFANKDSAIDLSSFGSKDQVEVVISGPDMNVVTSQGTTIIVNGALYSSVKGNSLTVKFSDGVISGNQLISHVELNNIGLERMDSALVDSTEDDNDKSKKKAQVEKEQAELDQKIEEAKKAKEEAEKAKEEAEKAKEEAEKSASEIMGAQNASQEIENMLSEFLADNASKASMASFSDNTQEQNQDIKPKVKEGTTLGLGKPIDINTGKGRSNSSGKSKHISDEPVLPKFISVSLKLDNESNSGSKNDLLTNVGIPKFIGSTAPGASVIIKLDSISIDQIVADSLGNFEFSSPTQLNEGHYVFSVEATDLAGATGSTSLKVTVDQSTLAPTFELSAEDQSAAGNTLTANSAPTIKGTAERDAVVRIFVGNKLVTEVSTNKLGEWEYPFKNGELAEGNNLIKLVATDKADNRATTNGTIEVDSTPPAKPTVALEAASDSGLTGDNITNKNQPIFVGHSEPNSQVTLILDGVHLADVLADKSGVWRFPHSSSLKDGKYTLSVIASDLAGNKSEESELQFDIDTIISNFSAQIVDEDDSHIVGDNITNVTHPRLSGMTEPDSEIKITNNTTGETLTITSDNGGKWNFSFLQSSKEGSNNLTFTVRDQSDNSKDYSFNYVVDTSAPLMPIAELASFVTLPNGNIVTSKDHPVFVGQAEAGSTVLIVMDGRADTVVKVGANGQWEYTFQDKLVDKNYSINFITQDIAGNKSPSQQLIFSVQTETIPPTAQLEQMDDSGVIGDWITKNHSDLSLLGTAQPYSTVKVNNGTKLIGTTKADEAGNWKLDLNHTFASGEHTINIVTVDLLQLTASHDYQLTIDDFTKLPSIMLHDSSDSGVKNDHITKVTAPSFTGTAEAGSTVTLYVNNIKQETTIANSDGTWNMKSTSGLNDGMNNAVVKVEDIAGNTSQSDEYHFTVMTSTVKPTIKLSNDTGFDTSDKITKDNKLKLIGTAAAFAKVTLQDENSVIATVKADKEGKWQFEFSDSQILEDADYRFSARVEDIAGNIAISDFLDIQVDTKISIPVIELSAASDTGVQGDNLTKFSTPQLLIKNVDLDVREVVLWDAKTQLMVGSAINLGKGIWSYTFTDVLLDDQHQFYVRAEDIAGNKCKSEPFTFTVDTKLDVPTIALISGEDTGSSTSDNLTNKARPQFILTDIDQDVAEVKVTVTDSKNKVVEIVDVKQDINTSQWVFSPLKGWADGEYQLKVTVTDKAGNQETSQVLDVQIDTTLAAPAIALVAGQDTGSSNSDQLTNINTPIFSLTTDPDVETLMVKVGSDLWVAATRGNVAGEWSYTPPTLLPDGKHTLTVQATDKAGNKADSSLTFTVDTTLAAPIITLATGQDTGSSSDDNLSNKKRPQFTLSSIDPDVVEVKVKITTGGSNVIVDAKKDSNNTWIFALNKDWKDGDYQLEVTATDKAGNQKTSSPLEVQIDTELDKPTIAFATGQQTGGVGAAGLTHHAQPKFDLGHIDADVVKTTVSIKNSISGATHSADAKQDASGRWSFTPSKELGDGQYLLTVTVTDKAGNTSTSDELKVEIDTTLTLPNIILAPGQDTGSATNDGLTHKKRPTFNLTNIDDDVTKVQVEVIDKNSSDVKTVDVTKAPGTHSWSFTPGNDWAEGHYQLKVTVTDKAGNTKSSAVLEVEVDHTLSSPIIAFAKGQDTGVSNNDQLTNIKTPTFSITTDTDVDKLMVMVEKDKWVTATKGKVAGEWSYTTTALADGKHTLVVKATDRAGNEADTSLAFTVDATLATPTIALAAGQDTGVSDSDGITNLQKPTFDLSNIDDTDVTTVEVTIENIGNNRAETATATKNSKGQWTFTPSTDWADGSYRLTVKVADAAGNTRDSKPLEVTIATKLTNLAIEFAEHQDTGSSDNDQLTNINTPTFNLTTDPEVEELMVKVGGGQWVAATKGKVAGDWSYQTPKLPDGKHTLEVKATDKAGNTADKALDFKIDTELKTPTIKLNDKQDTGSNATDGITSLSQPEFIIGNVASDVANATVKIGGKEYAATQNKSNGIWSFKPAEPLPEGNYNITVQVEDHAGNTKTSDKLAFEIDLSTEVTEIKLLNDTGKSKTDYITQTTTPQFEIVVPSDTDSVQVKLAGTGSWVTLTKSGNKWLYSPILTEDKTYTLNVKVTDIAGNTAVKTQVFTVDTKVTTPTIQLSPDSDTGDDTHDNITNKDKPKFVIDNIDDDIDKVVVTIDGKQYNATQNGTAWSFTPTTKLPDGQHDISVTVTDIAGNSQTSDIVKVEVDTKTEITSIKLAKASDSGADQNGALTQVVKPTFEVVVPSDVSHVQGSVDGKNWVNAIQQNSGLWSFQPNDNLAEGNYTLKIKARDKAGNEIEKTLPFVIDTHVDGLKIEMVDDTGKKAGGLITHVTAPRFNILANEILESVSVDLNGKKVSLLKDAAGKWSFTPEIALAEGIYNLKVTATDKAGNTTDATLSFEIDTTLNTPEIDLVDADDSGDSSTDNITNVKAPKFVITQVPQDIDTVTVTLNNKKYPVALLNSSYVFTPPPLSDGNYKAVVTFTDKAGNSAEKELLFTIDTSVHLTVSMDSASDSGTPSDNVTKNPQPKFNVAADPGSLVEVTIINKDTGEEVYREYKVKIAQSGTWISALKDNLPDGNYTLKVSARDTTGNSEEKSVVFTIDTKIDDPTIELASHAANDKFTALDLNPTFIGTAEKGSSIKLSIDGDVSATISVDANGKWKWEPTMPMGEHKVSITATDSAGNISDTVEILVKIPFLHVNQPTILLDKESDSGVLGDFITSKLAPTISGKTLPGLAVNIYLDNQKIDTVMADKSGNYTYTFAEKVEGSYGVKVGIINPKDAKDLFSDPITLVIDTHVDPTHWEVDNIKAGGYINTRQPVLNGTSEPKSEITIFVDGVKYHNITVSADGSWQALLPDLGSDGKYTLSLEVKDVAGNITASSDKIAIIVDSSIVVPTVEIDKSTDSGNEGDYITNNKKPLLTGSTKPGAQITLYQDNREVSHVIADDNGKWQYQYTDELKSGDYNIRVTAKDKAGNSQDSEHQIITIDTDTHITIAEIKAEDGHVPLNSDIDGHISLINNPKFRFESEIGNQAEIFIDGILVKTMDIAYSHNSYFKVENALKDGPHTLVVIVSDAAGNTMRSEDFNFEVMTSNEIPVILDAINGSTLAPLTVDGKTYITDSNQETVFSGTAKPNSEITITFKGLTSIIVKADDVGAWSIPIDLALLNDGPLALNISSKDKAGFTHSGQYTLWLDTAISEFSYELENNQGTQDNWGSHKDSTVIKGKGEVGAVVSLILGGKEIATTTVDVDGHWTISTEELPEGQSTITLKIEDLPGHEKSVDQQVMIDRTNPEPPEINEQEINKKNRIELSGTAIGASKVIIRDNNGKVIQEAMVDEDGEWSISVKYQEQGKLVITSQSATGRESTPVDIDLMLKQQGLIVLDHDSDTGVSGDNMTHLTKPTFTISNLEQDVTTVVLKIGDVEFSAKQEADGRWTATPDRELPHGHHTITATVTDGAGNSGTSMEYGFDIDTELTKPTIMVATSLKGVDGTDDSAQPIYVIKDIDSDVDEIIFTLLDSKGNSTVYNERLENISPDKNGEYRVPEPDALQGQDYQLSIQVIDKAGNQSTSDTIVVKQANTPLEPPKEGEPQITLLEASAGGSVTRSHSPKFEVSLPKDVVTVVATLNNIDHQPAIVGRKAVWQTPMPTEEGQHTLSVKFVDKEGDFLIKEKTFTVDRSSDGVINSMASSGISSKETTSSVFSSDQHDNEISEVYAQSAVNPVSPIDEDHYYY
ncbi:Ig-like domain-containing protein [Yersinia mollaretii]|uniref:Ig-like domain-containing protein n=1 Tax=Yersinia mollaretii TaxID=33060 RepID=UPI0011A9A105|nr:Ig-like domain-containing protein [Yersinia mollaretii]